MKVLYLGLQYNSSYDNMKKLDLKRQYAVSNFQESIIDGLTNQSEVTYLFQINSYPVGSYPKHHSKILFKKTEYKTTSSTTYNIGFINLPLIKQISRFFSTRKELKKVVRKMNVGDKVLIYDSYLPYLFALFTIKKFRNIDKTIIVADLPNKYGIKKDDSMFLRPFRCFEGYLKMRYIKKFDKYVFLTNHMSSLFNSNPDKYVVVEGIHHIKEPFATDYYRGKEKIILYTGTTNYEFGMYILVELVKKLDDSFQLWIFGSGDFDKELSKLASENSRLRYFPPIEHESILDVQRKAYILVNPRSNSGQYTKYSFPSKIMDYLYSGKPVLVSKLEGIPDEYDEYVNYFENENVNDLVAQIYHIDSKYNEYMEKANLAKNFITTYKNSRYQVSKIIQLMNK